MLQIVGDMMSLIYEYGENKKNKEQERIIKNLFKSGMDAETISKTAIIPLSRVKAIEMELKS